MPEMLSFEARASPNYLDFEAGMVRGDNGIDANTGYLAPETN